MTGADVAPVRHLGRFRLLAVGVNSVIGGGIFVMPAVITGLAGAAGLYAYVAAGVVVLGVGLALAALASGTDASGGPYLYVRRAFGEFAGFQVGWLFCLARLTAMANLMNAFALYLGRLIPDGGTLLWRTLFVAGCATAVVALNVIGIRQTSRATNLLAVAKVLPLVVLGGAGLFFMDPARFAMAPVEPAHFVRAVLLLIFAFSGFEILTVPAEESLRPRRDMPFALFGTIAVVSAIYLLVHTAVLGMLPGLAADKAPLATAAGILAGPGGRYAMIAFAAVSTAGCTLVSLVGANRLLYAMARAGQIPAFIGALDPVRRTPAVASFLMGGLASVLAIAGGYEQLAAVSAGTRLLVYLACCLACLRGAAAGTAAWPRRALAAATAVAIVALLTALERKEILFGTAGIACGTLLWLGTRPGRVPHGIEGEVR